MAESIGLPQPSYLRKVIRRSSATWLLVRCAYVIVLMVGVLFHNLLPLADGAARALHPVWPTRPVLIVVTSFLVWWERKRSREFLFHANLRAHPGWFWAASLLTACVLDIAAQTLLDVL